MWIGNVTADRRWVVLAIDLERRQAEAYDGIVAARALGHLRLGDRARQRAQPYAKLRQIDIVRTRSERPQEHRSQGEDAGSVHMLDLSIRFAPLPRGGMA